MNDKYKNRKEVQRQLLQRKAEKENKKTLEAFKAAGELIAHLPKESRKRVTSALLCLYGED